MKKALLTLTTLMALSAPAHAVTVDQYEDALDQIETQTTLPNDGFVCAARGAAPHVFKAFGYLPERVQRRAYWKCERHTNGCRTLGCKPVGDQ